MASPIPKFESIEVSDTFDNYPNAQCEKLLFLR